MMIKKRLKTSLVLNWLDYTLLFLITLVMSWFYYRSSIELHYQWHWQEAINRLFTTTQKDSLPYFFQGLIATIRLSIWGIFFALVFGVLLGFARFSKQPFFTIPATAYVLLIRNIPPLVFVFIFYFFISNQLIPLLGLKNVLREHAKEISALQAVFFGPANLWENLLSGVLCIGLLSAAYIAEIVRAGLESIPKGQWEASKSLGLSFWVSFRKVMLPQVLTSITPALAGQTIALVKDSSIVALISIQELTFVGTEMANSSGYLYEIWLIVGLTYLILCLSLSRGFAYLEKRHRRHLR